MRSNRRDNELRRIEVTPGYNRHAEGSALVKWGDNIVVSTVSIEQKLPPHLRGKKGAGGWLTAEYSLLPRSTEVRVQRERLFSGGRSQEIQRLLGRTFRSVFDLQLFPNQTITVDVDVVQADGGTRCAGIVAGYAALHDAANALVFDGTLAEWPLRYELGAVSVGAVNGRQLVDLEFSEDAEAHADLNVVATGDGRVVEVQGGSEGAPLDAQEYVTLVATGITAVQRLVEIVRPQLAGTVESSF